MSAAICGISPRGQIPDLASLIRATLAIWRNSAMNAIKHPGIQANIMPKLEAHYSARGLTADMIGSSGVLLFLAFGFFLGLNWFTLVLCAAIAMLVVMVLTSWYRLLTRMGQVIVSIDAAGFKDIRLTPTVIPWSAIQSVSPVSAFIANKATGVALVIDPAFKRSLAIPLSAKLVSWNALLFGRSLYVDTRCLDVDCGELSRVAEAYISKTSLSAS